MSTLLIFEFKWIYCLGKGLTSNHSCPFLVLTVAARNESLHQILNWLSNLAIKLKVLCENPSLAERNLFVVMVGEWMMHL